MKKVISALLAFSVVFGSLAVESAAINTGNFDTVDISVSENNKPAASMAAGSSDSKVADTASFDLKNDPDGKAYMYTVMGSWNGNAPADEIEGTIKFAGTPSYGAVNLNKWDTGPVKYNGQWAQYVLTTNDLSDVKIEFIIESDKDTQWEFHSWDDTMSDEEQAYEVFSPMDISPRYNEDYWEIMADVPEDTEECAFVHAVEKTWTYTLDSAAIQAAVDNWDNDGVGETGSAQFVENGDGTWTLGFNIQVGHMTNAKVTAIIYSDHLLDDGLDMEGNPNEPVSDDSTQAESSQSSNDTSLQSDSTSSQGGSGSMANPTNVSSSQAETSHSSNNNSNTNANTQTPNAHTPAPGVTAGETNPANTNSKRIGDVTQDDKLSVSDILTLASIVKQGGTADEPVFTLADMNKDGKITVSDILALAALIKQG